MAPTLIIQARRASTRLPGKVLMDIGGLTMLARVVRRSLRTTGVEKVVVATTVDEKDDAVLEEAAGLGVEVFRGSEQDVLDRYYQAAKALGADPVLRVTADCPLIDPEVVDRVLAAFLRARPGVDFAANTLTRTYPQGLDVEVASLTALGVAWREAEHPYQRVHVFPYIYEDPSRFRVLNVADEQDRSWMRWTVDTEEDLRFVRDVYARLGNDDGFSWLDVMRLLEREPKLMEINRHVRQKELAEG